MMRHCLCAAALLPLLLLVACADSGGPPPAPVEPPPPPPPLPPPPEPDTTPPAGQLSLAESVINEQTPTITLVASEEVQVPALRDFSLTGARLDAVYTDGDDTTRILIKISASGDGPCELGLPAGKLLDLAGNASTTAINTRFAFDFTAPTCSLTAPASPCKADPIGFQLHVSEAVSGLVPAAITLKEGTLLGIEALLDEPGWEISVDTVHDAQVDISIDLRDIVDAAGNAASGTLSAAVHSDLVGPEVRFTKLRVFGKADEPVTVTVAGRADTDSDPDEFQVDISDWRITDGLLALPIVGRDFSGNEGRLDADLLIE